MTATIVTRQIDAGDLVFTFAVAPPRCPYCHQDLALDADKRCHCCSAPATADDCLALLRYDLDSHVAAGHQVAPMILDNAAWLAAMEDAGFIVDLATAIPVALDVTRPPSLPLL